MRDGVRRNQIFEPEQVLQNVLAHDEVRAARVRPADILENALEHLQEERAGAAGEIKHGHAFVVGNNP